MRKERQPARQKVSIDDRPRRNRRHHGYTAPPRGICGGFVLVSCPRERAGDRFRAGDRVRLVSSDESRHRDPLALRHSSLPTLPGGHPSRRDAAVKPVDLQGQPMEVRELPRAAREEPMDLRKEQARLRGAPPRCEERPTGLRTVATGPQPEETGLGRGLPAAPLPRWIVARSAHG
jgi:hypothetical protein